MAVAIEKGAMIPTANYHSLIQKMRDFFLQKNFKEVAVQSRLSILAACEDPFTVCSFQWGQTEWPLPQTGQMWLEYELLNNPHLEGVFCISTSYRNEPNPIPGRHETIFPLFEFESHGDMEDLIQLEKDMLIHFGFDEPGRICYADVCTKYGVELVGNEEESKLCEERNAMQITNFPLRAEPFWNMKYAGNDLFNKVDVILCGQETIGSAERSCNKEEMRHFFDTITEGKYRKKLYELFGEKRVEEEMQEFLSHNFFPRFGGAVGVTRFLSALRQIS